MKKLGYFIFAAFFYLFRFIKPQNNKVFCVMTHDASEGSSVGVVVAALKRKSDKYKFYYLKKSDRNLGGLNVFFNCISFFIIKAYHMATSSVIMMDNVFLPMAYLKFHKKVKVIQLWHGTGTIKKFGQDVNVGELGRLERRANQAITHLIVNSDYTKKQYSGAFGIDEAKIYVWGLPRTDEMFQEKTKERKRSVFYKEYPDLKNKKLVLYAPTFRDEETDNPQICLDVHQFVERTEEDTVLLLKCHPFIAARANLDSLLGSRVRNVSFYQDINTLLMVCDILITDYSSIIFEYCILEKPMIFYAYDLKKFENEGRGFYEPYEDYVPGPVAKNTQDIINLICNNKFNLQRVLEFRNISYRYLDGTATERLIENIFQLPY